jgi:D-alanine-D-alanine ligase
VDRAGVVKPVRAGSSHGVALVTEEEGLAPAIAAAAELDYRVLVEELVTGREIDIAVLESPGGPPVVSPALEIVLAGGSAGGVGGAGDQKRVFDYAAKYGGDADFRVPAPLPDHRRRELEEQAVTVYQALGCAGLARVDFFLTDTGWVLNEINTSPGFTETSQAPRMFAAAGIGYPQLLDRMICTALSTGGGWGERG